MKKALLLICGMLISVLMCGCSIQIWETPPVTEAQYEASDKIELDTYYIKNGTKFSEVYLPNCSFSGMARYVDQSRVIYMYDDQPMIPEHYKGEIIAYSSTSAEAPDITLERFKDMGYSLGIYGGEIQEDGYYHMDSKSNVCPDSEAEELFSKVASSKIRIVSIGNVPIKNVVDQGSGIITSLEKGKPYLMEFYAGTFFYRIYFTPDTQFLKAMELYNYEASEFKDTQNGYKNFETPETLRSGYYLINNSGLFLYHDFTKEEYVEDESLNESGFDTEAEALASFSQEFKVSVPYDTKDVIISAKINNLDNDASGKVIAPNGTVYDMNVNVPENTITLELSVAKAGDWTVYIPQYLDVLKVDVDGSEMAEETVCEMTTFTFNEEQAYQRFEMNIYGNGKVYAYMTRESDQRVLMFTETSKHTKNGEQRYIYLDVPYIEPGTYTASVYYYQSNTELGEMIVTKYADSDSDIFIIE